MRLLSFPVRQLDINNQLLILAQRLTCAGAYAPNIFSYARCWHRRLDEKDDSVTRYPTSPKRAWPPAQGGKRPRVI